MKFFKRPHLLRRYSAPEIVDGYSSIPYEDMTFMMDIQTTDRQSSTDEAGTKTIQRLKIFCDSEIYAEDETTGQKGDRVWFQGKWFECTSSRLSENTPLRHWTTTFTQCLTQEPAPGGDEDEHGTC